MLQSGLPNLSKFHSQQTAEFKNGSPERNEKPTSGSLVETEQSAIEENNSSRAAASDSGLTQYKSGHILGLDCYSSSDEDTNT